MLTPQEYADLGPNGQRARIMGQRREYRYLDAQRTDKVAFDAYVEAMIERITKQQQTPLAFEGGPA